MFVYAYLKDKMQSCCVVKMLDLLYRVGWVFMYVCTCVYVYVCMHILCCVVKIVCTMWLYMYMYVHEYECTCMDISCMHTHIQQCYMFRMLDIP